MSKIAMTLAAGVFMVWVPLGRDQGGNANGRLRGAGLTAEASGVANAVGALIAGDRHHRAARRIAHACKPLGRGAHATDLVKSLTRDNACVAA